MNRNLALPPALILALFCTAGTLCRAGMASRPDWADEEPLSIRGLLESSGPNEYRLVVSATTEYVLVAPLPKDLSDFAGLRVEIKGWAGKVGERNMLQALDPSEPPRVLVPAWWSLPFALLLACIALLPLIHKRFWERSYRWLAAGLGLAVVLVYVLALGRYGRDRLLETAAEYFKFISLIGSLYVVTGGILIEIPGRGRPWLNTLFLFCGALLANLIGTTGASALLIRPYLRLNKGRLRPFHVVFFIFIVSNCGGVLTPIGDPPLFLGYLRGVPFLWTIVHCLPAWLIAVGLLAAIFFVLDWFATRRGGSSSPDHPMTRSPAGSFHFSGALNVLFLGLVLFAVFLDKILPQQFAQFPFGALLMLAAAWAAYRFSSQGNLARNEFSLGPIKEVAWLFLGIFGTMVPTLDYLAANAGTLGITTPGGFFFASGALSSFLDNAPTYLNFLSAAHGLRGVPMLPQYMRGFIASYGDYLLATSLGSVFFGACTYIGNGPNLMVKAIADSEGVPTPSFLGYIFGYSIWFLVPVYVVVWLVCF